MFFQFEKYFKKDSYWNNLRVRLNNFSSLVSLWLRHKLTPAPPMLNIHIGTAPFGTTQAT